jgi:hypothetical protein
MTMNEVLMLLTKKRRFDGVEGSDASALVVRAQRGSSERVKVTLRYLPSCTRMKDAVEKSLD